MAYYYTCLGDNNILHTLNASWVPPIDIILFNAHHEPGWWVLFFNPLILLVSQPSLRSHLHHLPYWFYPQDTTWTIYLALYRVNLLVQGTLLPHLASCSNSSLFYSGTRPICVVARITFLKCILIHIASPCKILLCKALWKLTHHTLALLIPPASPASSFAELCLLMPLQALGGLSFLEHALLSHLHMSCFQPGSWSVQELLLLLIEVSVKTLLPKVSSTLSL